MKETVVKGWKEKKKDSTGEQRFCELQSLSSLGAGCSLSRSDGARQQSRTRRYGSLRSWLRTWFEKLPTR